MQRDLGDPRAAKRAGLRRAPDRVRVERRSALPARGAVHEPQLRAALRDERVAVRQEREAERMREPVNDDRDLDAMLLGGVERIRLRAQRDRLDAEIRLLLRPDDERERRRDARDERLSSDLHVSPNRWVIDSRP